jgi:hypothetical protein
MSVCKKCGSLNIGTTYRPGKNYRPRVERLDKLCRTCGYRWTERPLDWRGREAESDAPTTLREPGTEE